MRGRTNQTSFKYWSFSTEEIVELEWTREMKRPLKDSQSESVPSNFSNSMRGSRVDWYIGIGLDAVRDF